MSGSRHRPVRSFKASEVVPGVRWLELWDVPWSDTSDAQGANVTIVGDSSEVVIIDSAFSLPAPHGFITGALAGMGSPKVRAIILTHFHWDHAGGAGALREATGAPILIHEHEAELVTNRSGDFPGVKPDGTFRDGAAWEVGGVRLEALLTPGHAPGHCCFWLPQSRSLLSGDLILGNATTSVSPPHGSMPDLLASFRRVLELDLGQIVPSHGPLIADGRANVLGVIAHREKRREQVMAAVLAGARTPAGIVRQIYVGLAARLVPQAGRQVRSMLALLEAEGRVVRLGAARSERWRAA